MLKDTLDHLARNHSWETLDETGIRIHVSGCRNNCCPSNTAEIGLRGRQVKENDEITQVYDIILGGSLGANPSFGRVVKENVDPDDIKYGISSLIDNFQSNKEPGQSFTDFCNDYQDEALAAYLEFKEKKE